jgi:glutathione synthase/RimK-type ligase-like ATP-grasp enzyme
VALARKLENGIKVVSRERVDAVARFYNGFVNWGSSRLPDGITLPVINIPSAVAKCVNKRTFFEEVGDLTNMAVAYSRAEAENLFSRYRKVVCRTNVTGSGGDGIVIARSRDELVNAQLYTAYIPKRAEYRVHVVGGEIILIQQKRRRADLPAEVVEDTDAALIRNHANGWVYAVDNVDPPSDELKEACIEIVSELGLDFGAVDVMVGARNNEPYILEVNTAPGIQSPTLAEAYRAAMLRLIGGKVNVATS